MSLLPQNQSGNTQAQNERRRKLAERLLQQNQEAPQGQMVGGVFVAPSWTQYLAKGLGQYNARKEMSNADKSDMDLQRQKQEAIAALLKPAEQTGENPLETRPPEQIENEKRMKLYQAVSQFGNDPSLQLALEDMNYQRNRGDKRADIQDERGYQGTIRAEDRSNKLADIADQRAYEDVVRKENQGFQLTQQERGFKQQFELQRQSQGFQAGQNALSRAQQERLAGLNDAPVSVLGADGKPMYVTRQQALGMQPYSAKQEAQDVAKVQQKSQAELSAQQVLDQAALLYGHKGREAGTGLSSFMSNIPATNAKDFKANLDTFKAQTFVPMVSALKGMGALSDAEGKKLSESVGALDPSMSEKAFAESLQRITKTLYDKAKANGLNVALPDFAATQPQQGATGGWSIQPVK